MAENIVFLLYIFFMVFVFFFIISLWYFSMLILCSVHSFSRSTRWLRYWCAEIMNYETVVQPSAAATPFSTLYTCILMRCHPYFSLYTLASHTENYSWRPALSTTVYSLSPPRPYTYDTHIYIYICRHRRGTINSHPIQSGPGI